MKLTVFFVYLFYNCMCIFANEIGSFRLSTDVIPSHYSIKIRPYIEDNNFDGEVSIYVRSRNILEKITIHSSNLSISQAFINQIPATFKYEADEKISLSYTNDSIQPGEHVLYIKYKGILLRNGKGVFRASFNYLQEEGFLLVTDFEPTGARKAFPCFDEPAFKAKFNLRLIAPDDTFKTISNMQEINRFTTSYGVVYDFATSVIMSTYLVSFAMTKYSYYEDVLEEDDRKIPIRIYTFNANKANNQFATNCTKNALKFYTEYTNISYPLHKLDMIEYNRPLSAAMENWGLITFREGLLSLNLGTYTRRQIKIVMYHELAHFWFGNLVTNEWWNDVWLQEGFATYMSYKLCAKENEQEKQVENRNAIFNWYNEVTAELPSRPVVDYLKTQELLKERFDKIIYNKGASVLLMIDNIIGEEVFQKVVRKFLKKYAYKTATTNDFISMIEDEVPHIKIRDFIESYLYQNRFPLINVVKDNGKYVLEQQVGYTTAKFKDERQKWTFPITYITNVNKTPTLKWFDKDMDNLTIEEPGVEWILFNEQHIGVYRVNFSVEVWETLTKHFKNMTLEESKLLVNEANYAFKFGKIDCSVLFNLMKHVEHLKRWMYFTEFHVLISTGLRCSGYTEERDIYLNFLQRKFTTLKWARNHKTNCTDIADLFMENGQANISLKKCARWIKDNLSPNGNDISEN